MSNEWNDAKLKLPTKEGWYDIKTIYGEYEAPFFRTFGGKLIWVIPDDRIITHWKEKDR